MTHVPSTQKKTRLRPKWTPVMACRAQAQTPCAVRTKCCRLSCRSRSSLLRETVTQWRLRVTNCCDGDASRGGTRGDAAGGTWELRPHGAGCACSGPQPRTQGPARPRTRALLCLHSPWHQRLLTQRHFPPHRDVTQTPRDQSSLSIFFPGTAPGV